MLVCDPPGNTSPENLQNFGDRATDVNYIYFHDQEPIHIELHGELFQSVVDRNWNMNFGFDGQQGEFYRGPVNKAIVTSEYQSESVEKICQLYGWKSYYYFFHGWAALDWYRGYNRSFVMQPPHNRIITNSFISPNRIVGGLRGHRLLLMYHLLLDGTHRAHISFPKVCPAEKNPVTDIVKMYRDRYPDIVNVFESADLPRNFQGEIDHPMHSCWLSLFDLCQNTMAHVVTETVFFGRKNHLTEKVFKPICLQMPFVLASTAHSLKYLRDYGFKTFGDVWDESYDQEEDDFKRLEKIAKLLISFDRMPVSQLQSMYQACIPAIVHNYEHFYSGAFEQVLWQELTAMLNDIQHDLNQ